MLKGPDRTDSKGENDPSRAKTPKHYTTVGTVGTYLPT